MKNTYKCPKCGFGRILHIVQVADSDGESVSRPAKIARLVQPVSFLGVQLDRAVLAGDLEAGVCRRCGYTELYVKDPASIPVDGRSVREFVAPGGG
ncbi:MAG: hypothetical protein HY744_01570 [Deltaproteobacteria bacterium]|nr:hypothetical protein [Deltaproteobacteria bacterium]